jgi:hypothetical protein
VSEHGGAKAAYEAHWGRLEREIQAKGGGYADTVLELQTVRRIREESQVDPNATQRFVTDTWRAALELEQREKLAYQELSVRLAEDLRQAEWTWIGRCLRLLSRVSEASRALSEEVRAEVTKIRAEVTPLVIAYRNRRL